MVTSEKMVNHAFFAGMSDEHLRVLGELSMPVRFAANELIFHEGDPANRFYLIERGRVALEAHVAERGNIVVEIINAGDVLGWSWLFPPYVWHFDARALDATVALFFYATALREKCEEDPVFGYQLMQRTSMVLLNRLQATRRRLLHFARLTDDSSAR